ncbi:FkbM family methyltransferase, partial [Helicobacter vulpis]|uniref:FkbM family methyltransferase n=1 Tax=Helicobacter vulpis TaxID=2316076 RepID=UPI002E265745
CAKMVDAYLKFVRPVALERLIRVGGNTDGGYVMYPPPPPQSNPARPKALSLGVSIDSPWDLEMAQMGYLVLQYDASIEQAPDAHPNIIFHKKFVGTRCDPQTTTLEQILLDYSFDPKAHNILQMDIEGVEWEIFEKLDFKILEKHFAQVIVEFHACNPCAILQAHKKFEILERLQRVFQPIHLHFNSCGRCYYVQDRFFGDLLEVSYLRRDLLPFLPPLRNACGNIKGLDYPNEERLPNIPIIFA